MKKTVYFFIAVMAFMTMACVNQEFNPDQQTLPLKFNITMNDPYGTPATKAKKTGWVIGDRLNIWFDSHKADDYANPDVIIEYNGSSWEEVAGSCRTDLSLLASGGKMLTVYAGTYEWSGKKTASFKEYTFASTKSYEDYKCSPLLFYTENAVGYTYNSGTNTVTTNLTGWKYLSTFKVLVKGTTEYGPTYVMNVENTSKSTSAGIYKGFKIGCSDFKVYPIDGAGYTGGVNDTDGTAFFFSSFSFSTSDNIKFSLKVYDNDPKTKTISSPSAFTSANTGCQEVALNFSQFN